MVIRKIYLEQGTYFENTLLRGTLYNIIVCGNLIRYDELIIKLQFEGI